MSPGYQLFTGCVIVWIYQWLATYGELNSVHGWGPLKLESIHFFSRDMLDFTKWVTVSDCLYHFHICLAAETPVSYESNIQLVTRDFIILKNKKWKQQNRGNWLKYPPPQNIPSLTGVLCNHLKHHVAKLYLPPTLLYQWVIISN